MTKADHYFRGDACKFTGATDNTTYSIPFYTYEIIEGHRKGEKIVSAEKPFTTIEA